MQGINYNVDIVMCIDCTASMGGILETVKTNALSLYSDLQKELEKKSKVVDRLRIKVIAFRDFYVDGDQSIEISEFYDFPASQSHFSDFVSSLKPLGGGDEPENALEALSLAINSDWNKSGDKRREIIIVWTDASAHPLEKSESSSSSNYPTNVAKNFDDLTDWWEGQEKMSSSAKRLVVFAPDAYPWTEVANHWENTVHYPSKAGMGLDDVHYTTILDAIVQSV